MASPVTIPTPVANGSMADAQGFVNSLPGSMSPQQRSAIAADNQGWHPSKTTDNTPDFIPEHGTATGNAPDFIPAAEPPEPPPKSFDDPRVGKLGYYVNGDGNVVIAPKEGEEYQDTIRRAVDHYKKMSPQDREAAIGRESNDSVKKIIGTMGGAAGIGVAGAAGLSAVYAPLEMHSLMSAGIKALVPALTAGATAVGEWAAAHPVAAKTVYETLKLGIHAAGAAAIAGAARKVINAAD